MSVLPYKALYKHYRKNSLQLVLLIISLVLSISLLVSVLEINVLTKSVMVNNQANYLDEFRYTIAPIKKTGPSVYKQYQLINNKVPDKCLILQNAKLRTLNHSIDLTLIDPLQLKRLNKGNSQVFLKNITQKLEQNNVLLTPNAARGINIQSNEPFAQHINQNRNFDFYITNLFWGEPNVILASKNYKTHNLASFTKESQHISCINLSSDSLEKVFSVVDKDFRFEKKQTYNFKPITQYFYILLFTIGMLAFCIGIFVFYQTMSLSFAQRQILIGQLRKLGLSRIKIIFIFLLEIIAFLLLGLFFGNIIGFWLVNLSISELSYTFERIYGFSLYNSPAWDYSWLKVSFSLAFIGLLLAFGWPILRVVKINSKDLAKHISFYYILKREYLWQAITSLAVFIISVIMLISLDIEWKYKEYLFLIAFVICSSLIFPYFLRLITQFLSKVSKNNLIKWFFLDISSSLSFRTISTVLLLLSFIGMISIQILVKNYEHNSNTWLEKKYKYDFEISLQSSEYEPVLSWLESQRDVNNIHIKMINYSYFRKKIIKIISFQNVYLNNKKGLNNEELSVKQVHNYHHIMVNRKFLEKFHLQKNSIFKMDEINQKLKIENVLYGGDTFYPEIIVKQNLFRLLSSSGDIYQISFSLKSLKANHISSTLISKFNLKPNLINKSKYRHDFFRQVLDKSFYFIGYFSKFIFILAILGIYFSSLAGEERKIKQLALLKCLGLKNVQLILVSLGELIYTGLICFIFALPLSIIFCLSITNFIISANILMDSSFSLPYITILYDAVFALFSLLIIGILPLIKLSKSSTSREIKKYF